MECRDGESSAFKGKVVVGVGADGDRLADFGWLPEDDCLTMDSMPISEGAKRPFLFANIRTAGLTRLPITKNTVLTSNAPLDCSDEDAALSANYVKPDQMGTISVRLFLTKNLRESSPPSSELEDYGVQDRPPAIIDEKKKNLQSIASRKCIAARTAKTECVV